MIAVAIATGVLVAVFGLGIGIVTLIEKIKWRKR